tara:strand:- start:255 stop:449 length:195 start_codon:yes stop_codon:yes gene_type:complete
MEDLLAVEVRILELEEQVILHLLVRHRAPMEVMGLLLDLNTAEVQVEVLLEQVEMEFLVELAVV